MTSTMSLQQTKEQQRAKKAWHAISEVDGKPDDIRKKYRTLVLKSPIQILTNGLGQAVAFFASKSQPKEGQEPSPDNIAHTLLLKHLWGWLQESKMCEPSEHRIKDIHKMPFWVTQATSEQYRRATSEALAYLQWLRRFAEAVLPETEEGVE